MKIENPLTESSDAFYMRIRKNPCIHPSKRIIDTPKQDLSTHSYVIPHGNEDGADEDEGISSKEVMEQDERMLEEEYLHYVLGEVLEGMPFKMFILIIILLNSLVIGLQAFPYLEDNYGMYFHAFDRVCLVIFIMEMLFKLYYDFWTFWLEPWNIFDFIIISFTVLGNNFYNLTNARIFKILKVIRALRSLRSISVFQGLQIVIHTIWNSIPDMANIAALLLIFMFIFAIIGVSIFGEIDPRDFGNLWRAFITLYICLTQDGWVEVFKRVELANYYEIGAIYFIVFIVIGAFVLMNLIVAVVITVLERALDEEHEVDAQEKLSKARLEDRLDHRLVDGCKILKAIHFNQKPIEIPNYNFREKDLVPYIVVLSAMQANLEEFKTLRRDLYALMQNQKVLNNLAQMPIDSPAELPKSASLRSLSEEDISPDLNEFLQNEQKLKKLSISSSLRRRMSTGIHMLQEMITPQVTVNDAHIPEEDTSLSTHSILTTDVVSSLMRITSTNHVNVVKANDISEIFSSIRGRRII